MTVFKLTIGLDVGLNHFLIDSAGEKVDNPRFLKTALAGLARAQKGSANRAKRKRHVAVVHEGVANHRRDFIHQVTANLIDKNQATTFVVEDLHICGMVKNPKLARSIQDAGWGNFLTTLDYKCRWQGKTVIRIGRFQPSSKRCHCCGYKRESLPLSARFWVCLVCHTHHD